MLVLSRKESERIRLGNSIVLTVLRVAGDKVRLGIEAPADVVVLRDELKPHDQNEFSPSNGFDSDMKMLGTIELALELNS